METNKSVVTNEVSTVETKWYKKPKVQKGLKVAGIVGGFLALVGAGAVIGKKIGQTKGYDGGFMDGYDYALDDIESRVEDESVETEVIEETNEEVLEG